MCWEGDRSQQDPIGDLVLKTLTRRPGRPGDREQDFGDFAKGKWGQVVTQPDPGGRPWVLSWVLP